MCSRLKMPYAEISKTENPQGFEESKIVAKDGENIAGNALRELEERTGRKVVAVKILKIQGYWMKI